MDTVVIRIHMVVVEEAVGSISLLGWHTIRVLVFWTIVFIASNREFNFLALEEQSKALNLVI